VLVEDVHGGAQVDHAAHRLALALAHRHVQRRVAVLVPPRQVGALPLATSAKGQPLPPETAVKLLWQRLWQGEIWRFKALYTYEACPKPALAEPGGTTKGFPTALHQNGQRNDWSR
jgi:hypothetical protein